ncbi:MAG: guanosine-3',5'-bis(diphosphate) 3'-pyrophosphohydrolase [Gammaproteobacteria bacterium]|nr:guanosine-3',5'-bis(diphosphate) 3'-pyrophosphohydrolase [Gammaproteobacteria bacterium]
MRCKFYDEKLKRCVCKVLAKIEQGRIDLHIPCKPCDKNCTWFIDAPMSYSEAYAISSTLHLGQERKFTGRPYIEHPIAVASKFKDIDYKILAILHDVVEDTDMTTEKLISEYHLASHIAKALNVITRYEDQTYLDYIQQFKYNDLARAVKIEDIKHNISDLDPGCMHTKYSMALYILEEVIPSQIARGE